MFWAYQFKFRILKSNLLNIENYLPLENMIKLLSF